MSLCPANPLKILLVPQVCKLAFLFCNHRCFKKRICRESCKYLTTLESRWYKDVFRSLFPRVATNHHLFHALIYVNSSSNPSMHDPKTSSPAERTRFWGFAGSFVSLTHNKPFSSSFCVWVLIASNHASLNQDNWEESLSFSPLSLHSLSLFSHSYSSTLLLVSHFIYTSFLTYNDYVELDMFFIYYCHIGVIQGPICFSLSCDIIVFK